MSFRENPIIDTDSYKSSHYLQFPPTTDGIYCYLEPRTGGKFDHVLFFGLQAVLELGRFDQPVTEAQVLEANDLLSAHGLPFPLAGWMKVVKEYGGYMPLRIRAVPEGTLVPCGNVVATVESTDPSLFWLPGWVETRLERVWYPSTVATQSFVIRQMLRRALQRTGDEAGLNFKLHDFGSRGGSSAESVGLGGMGHLLSFRGTDTLQAIAYAADYYGEAMAGASIPASEHSTMTAWGRDGEEDAMANMIRVFGGPGKILACVSDSYDLKQALTQFWGGERLKALVRDSGSIVVVRPDSGDPVQTAMMTLESLEAAYGSYSNVKGYRVLQGMRVIMGDGNTQESIRCIIAAAEAKGFSIDNLSFGMGGGLLQRCDRDTLRWAYKASAVRVGGVWRGICKTPVTDPGKASKAGRVDLVQEKGQYRTVEGPVAGSCLVDYYHHGPGANSSPRLRYETFADIRARVLRQES